MFEVTFKSRIPQTESYPVRAGEISTALCDVPQAAFLRIVFHRHVRIEDRRAIEFLLVALTYSKQSMSISTSNDPWGLRHLDPNWEIAVSPVPKRLRHLVNSLLLTEAFPTLRTWLFQREKLHGRLGSDWIRVSFDRDTE